MIYAQSGDGETRFRRIFGCGARSCNAAASSSGAVELIWISTTRNAARDSILMYRLIPSCNRLASAHLLQSSHQHVEKSIPSEQRNSMRHEQQMSEQAGGLRFGLKRCDRPLDAEREPALGAHMVTPRRGYTHHGIYVGGGRVIQYGGLSRGLRRGSVEEVPLARFSLGRPVWVRVTESTWFDQHEVVRRARLRLGEDRYSVLTNNCEHFCEWCVRGEHRSHQVDERMAGYKGILLKLIELLARARPARRESTGVITCVGDRYQRAID